MACAARHKLKHCFAEWIAEGCGVLGTGGGGSPYPPFLVARQMLREGKVIKASTRCIIPYAKRLKSLFLQIVDPRDVQENAIFMRCMFMVRAVDTARRCDTSELSIGFTQCLSTFLVRPDFRRNDALGYCR